jgi:restriction system protein
MELGQTRAQLLAKHGPPGAEDHGRNIAIYFWEGWSAQVEFQGNTIGRLTYRRNWYLGDAEVGSLLQTNGGSSRWHEVVSPGGNRKWQRDDGAIATCLRQRPLSMTFLSPTLAATAAAEPEPKVFIPATPEPTFTKPTVYPRLLGTDVEPELPVADPPTSLETAPKALPRLPAAEIPVEPVQSPSPEPRLNLDRAAEAPQSAARPNPIHPSAIASEPPIAQAPSHTLAYTLVALILLGSLAGGGVYLHRRRLPGEVGPSLASFIPRPAPQPVAAAPVAAKPGAGFETIRLDQFEMLIGEIFRRQDYTVELSSAMSTDGAIDVTLRRDCEMILVQCKHWKMPRVTERELREFYAAMTASGAPRGVLVTTGEFTPGAQTFAEGKGIELMDGGALVESLALVAKPGENLLRVSSWLDQFVAHARIFDPECPVCHGTMTIRHSRANGAASWCCRSYPRCPGRREPRLDLLPAVATPS